MFTDWSVAVLAEIDAGGRVVGDADDGGDPVVPQLESIPPAITATAIPAMPIRVRSGRLKGGPPDGFRSS
jgi:hypothetical protein